MQRVIPTDDQMYDMASAHFLDFKPAKRGKKMIGRIVGDVIDLNKFEQSHPEFRYGKIVEIDWGIYARDVKSK